MSESGEQLRVSAGACVVFIGGGGPLRVACLLVCDTTFWFLGGQLSFAKVWPDAQIGNQSHIWNKNHKYVARFYSVSYHQGAQAPKTLATADGASVPKRRRHLSMPHEWSLYSEPSSIWYLVNFQSVADK